MPKPFQHPKKQYCPKCNWESSIVQTGDCLIGIARQCPKCGSTIPLKLKNADESLLSKLFSLIK